VSIVGCLIPVNSTARLPNASTSTLVSGSLRATKLRAAAVASASAGPAIERERSTAITTFTPRPRFSASAGTGVPFSRRSGACVVGFDVTTVTRIVG